MRAPECLSPAASLSAVAEQSCSLRTRHAQGFWASHKEQINTSPSPPDSQRLLLLHRSAVGGEGHGTAICWGGGAEASRQPQQNGSCHACGSRALRSHS